MIIALFLFPMAVTSVLLWMFRDYLKALFYGDQVSSDPEATPVDAQPLLSDAGSMNNNVEMMLYSPPRRTELRMKDIEWSNVLTIFLNGKKIEIVNPDPAQLLAYYIRDTLGLKGTKLGCEEGGCGACTVILSRREGSVSVNSCLRPLCANDGLAITTIEAIGSVSGGLSVEQERLVANNGTQCGYCTPGWIVNMHALNLSAEETGQSFTKRQVDAYFDGNICRCTGYRPIMGAFQSFAKDSCDTSCTSKSVSPCITRGCSEADQLQCKTSNKCCSDMEDFINGKQNAIRSGCCSSQSGCNTVKVSGKVRSSERDLALVRSHVILPLRFFNPVTGQLWVRPVTLPQLCAIMREVADTPEKAQLVQLVGGNTSIGVTKYLNGSAPYNRPDYYATFIDINNIPAMMMQKFDSSTTELTIGAALSISAVIQLLEQYAAPLDPSAVAAPEGIAGTVGSNESATGKVVNHRSIFSVTANHLSKIANTQVRNAGTWAGNLMVYLRYQNFTSDAVMALTTAGAVLQVCNLSGQMSTMDMATFLQYNIGRFEEEGLMIVGMILRDDPYASSNGKSRNISRAGVSAAVGSGAGAGSGSLSTSFFLTETFKVAQRSRNAHAHVNAGFQYDVTHQRRALRAETIVNACRIVYGGVSENIFIASQTEEVLKNAVLNRVTLSRAMYALHLDLRNAGLKQNDPLTSPSFQCSVMQSWLYQSLLRCFPLAELPRNLQTALMPWYKPVSRGVELYLPPHGDGKFPEYNPVGRPVHKLEAPIQATGEAVYPSDEAMPAQGLYGALVYSTQCAVTLSAIDCSMAFAQQGVVAVYTAADIPGTNACDNADYAFVPIGGEVKCIGEPIAVVVATSESVATAATALVQATYSSVDGKPLIVTLEQSIAHKAFFKGVPRMVSQISVGDAESALAQAQYQSKGRIMAGGQYHFYMEAQSAYASVSDGDCVTVVCGTQNPVAYQSAIASLLGLPESKVVVKCPRTGGGFGGKLTGGESVSLAAALCSRKLGRSVRIFNTRTADMYMQGGREGWIADYTVGYSADGTISALKYEFYVDAGYKDTDTLGSLYMGMHWADNAYYFANYDAQAKVCFTNTPAKTSMRAPGVIQSCLCTEMVIERVATELGLPLQQVQEKNFIQDGELAICGQVVTDSTLPTVWNTLLQRSRYSDRIQRVNDFNAQSLWRKRGIAICPVKYGMGWAGYGAGVQIGVRSSDGTVIVCHNGCEVGQGINTKAAQAVAMQLGIDLDLIRVVSTRTDRVVNGGMTGGSGTSEVVVQAAINACQTLNDRLAPYKQRQGRANGSSRMSSQEWMALLASLSPEVSLNSEGWYSPYKNPNGQPFQYYVYAACVTEVSLNVLTGEVHVLASEIVYDCGQSLNPAVDCGQIEGAFVMGLGYFLNERVAFDKTSGQLLTTGTWEYKPPLAQEIPSVFNLTLLKNQYNESGILGSKAVGEPPYIVSNSVYFAVKAAIASARQDAGKTGYFDLEVPATVDQRQKACCVSPERFVFPR